MNRVLNVELEDIGTNPELLVRNLDKLLNFSEAQLSPYNKEILISTHKFLGRTGWDEVCEILLVQSLKYIGNFKLRNPRSLSNLTFGDSQGKACADGPITRSFLNAKQPTVNNWTAEAGVNWIARGVSLAPYCMSVCALEVCVGICFIFQDFHFFLY